MVTKRLMHFHRALFVFNNRADRKFERDFAREVYARARLFVSVLVMTRPETGVLRTVHALMRY